MKLVCSTVFVLLVCLRAVAFAEPVLARVVEATGTVHGSGGLVKAGATLPASAALTTQAASRITFHGFPGSVISLGGETQAAISHIRIARNGSGPAIVRDASLKLDEGILSFAIDKVNWDTTTFEVITPTGRVAAKPPKSPATASVGVVEVRKGKLRLCATAGSLGFRLPSGRSIALNSGSVLTGADGSFEVVDVSSGEIASYGSSGLPLGTRRATDGELAAAKEAFSSSSSSAAMLTGSAAPGGLPGNATSQALPALPGAPNATGANPANVAGGVRSPER